MKNKTKVIALLMAALILSSCSHNTEIARKNYGTWEKEYGYSQVVKAGNTLYISGLASNKESLAAQIEEIYTVILSILKDYGLDSDAIVKQVIYAVDIEAVKAETERRKKFFKGDRYPSSTIVEIERLYEKQHLLEVEVVAFIDE